MNGSQKSTRQLLEKISSVNYLYRHTLNGTYYGIKKIGGKRKEHSLGTTDRKIAERWLKDWLDDLEHIDGTAAKTTLAQLIEKYEEARKGKSDKTIATDKAILTKFRESWSYGLDMRVTDVRPSHLNEWLAKHEARLKHTTYNRYANLLKQLFEIAVSDRMISSSPFEKVKTRWKKPQKLIRHVPTQEQFGQIVANIRSQKFSDDAEATADFVEFLGLAGLGQAEASTLTWGDIDWEHNRLIIRRHKTQNVFYVPIYPHLEPFLQGLQKKRGENAKNETLVLQIKDGKKALASACKRLGFPNFTQRNIRQVLIRRLWKSGVDYKLISKWQGHQDGGKLILDTYTEVFSADDQAYEKQQLGLIK